MIEVKVFKAEKDMYIGKNATFKEGRAYFARLSKNGRFYVMRSEEGHWIPLSSFEDSGYCIWHFKPEGFKKMSIVYMRSRKRINEFASPEEYFGDLDNWKQHFYSSTYNDTKLYKKIDKNK